MKNKGLIIFIIVLLVILVIGLVSGMVVLMNGNFKKFRLPYLSFLTTESTRLLSDDIYDTNIDQLSIDGTAMNIYIKENDSQEIRVVVYSNKNNIKIDNENQKLKIVENSTNKRKIEFYSKISKVEVYLPKTYEQKIKINNKYGDIKIDSLKQANIKVEEDCGNVTISEGNIIGVNNKYGDIKIEKATEVAIKESAGDVEIGTVSNAVVENKFGDIKIKKVDEVLNIINNCGDVKIDEVNLQKNSSIKSNLGDIKIGDTNEIYIDAQTNLGDTKINQNFRKSDIILTIKNDCGDIKVKN